MQLLNMIVLCHTEESLFSISNLSTLAQVIIAIANIVLAIYVFFYKRNKDKKTEISTAKLNEQNIKLQWFKELIIQPNLNNLSLFYENLHKLKNRIETNELSFDIREELNGYVKNQAVTVRKSFIDILTAVDKGFADRAQLNIDNLVDSITESIFNENINLKDPITFDNYIDSKITYARNDMISLIYNFNGDSK